MKVLLDFRMDSQHYLSYGDSEWDCTTLNTMERYTVPRRCWFCTGFCYGQKMLGAVSWPSASMCSVEPIYHLTTSSVYCWFLVLLEGLVLFSQQFSLSVQDISCVIFDMQKWAEIQTFRSFYLVLCFGFFHWWWWVALWFFLFRKMTKPYCAF